ncbi:MAG: sugar ABC transporter substrate-binding protein [Spirochaetaceae bacterium]|nr:sugar ABC transporter substrate-binding protein [Spirochaetaceae bacterium]
MKKIATILLAALVTCSVMFAGGSKDAGQKRVVFIARSMADMFPAWMAKSMEADMKTGKHNFKLEILDAQANDMRQNELIENAITNKYDVIIIQPNDTEASKPGIQKVINAKIPVILTNPRSTDPAILNNSNSVDADPYEQGAVVARYALTQIPQGARVVVFRGPDGNLHSVERRRAWKQEFFDKRPDVQIFREDSAHWMNDEAMKFMEDWVQASGARAIDAIVSMNDNMAMGALEAIKDNPAYGKIQAYGVDGDEGAAILIKSGRLTATAFQNANDLSIRILQMADDILSGKQTGYVNTDILCPLYTKDNVDELLAVHAGNK